MISAEAEARFTGKDEVTPSLGWTIVSVDKSMRGKYHENARSKMGQQPCRPHPQVVRCQGRSRRTLSRRIVAGQWQAGHSASAKREATDARRVASRHHRRQPARTMGAHPVTVLKVQRVEVSSLPLALD